MTDYRGMPLDAALYPGPPCGENWPTWYGPIRAVPRLWQFRQGSGRWKDPEEAQGLAVDALVQCRPPSYASLNLPYDVVIAAAQGLSNTTHDDVTRSAQAVLAWVPEGEAQ